MKIVNQNTTIGTSAHRDIAIFGEKTLFDGVLVNGILWPRERYRWRVGVEVEDDERSGDGVD